MKYNKFILAIAFVAVMTAPMAVFADEAPATTGADSSASASAPSTAGADSSAGSSSAPASSGADSSAGGSIPPTADAGSSAGVPPQAPVVSNPTGGASFGGGSSFGGGYAPVSAVSAGTILGFATTSCPLISSYMRLGMSNNSSDVAKLQAFLKNNEKINVAVTGTFDAQTEAAVEAFQNKYLSDVMGPWGATKSSGVVYITTMKKINQLACSQPLALSAADLAVIDAYKAHGASASTDVQAPAATGTQAPVITPVVGSAPVVGPVTDTAATANASVLGKFWSFLKNLF